MCGNPIQYESVKDIPTPHFAYLLRIMDLVRQSKLLNLEILSRPDQFEGLVNEIQDAYNSVLSSTTIQTSDCLKTSSLPTTDPMLKSNARIADFKESYKMLRSYIEKKLKPKDIDQNKIEYFDLARCQLHSGKSLWLCMEHRKQDHVQVLASGYSINEVQYQSDEYNTLLVDQIKKTRSEKN